ncbi:MAG: HlyD family efflux transporter periplasmic adaptor subunit [bacterium]|nr:HlyD family efflux transporter periplasmic adaptor subunit [bacterium]
MIEPDTLRLPQLRDDIDISQGAPGDAESSTWIIHDPLQHRFFQIDAATRDLLTFWKPGCTPAEMIEIAQQQGGFTITEGQVIKLIEFASMNNLIQADQAGQWRDLSERAAMSKPSLFSQFAHNYLFFKLPLVRPQQALQAALPYVEPLYSKTTAVILGIIGITGLYLTSRQWDRFLGTFDQFFSFEGMVLFGLSLILLKSMHELGHAFTAVRYGCRVPVIGVAFMMLTPLLYTDVSDAWRLTSRRKRMLVSSAGILVEMALAIIATFLWVFLPDGTGRSIAFMIATSGWIMSLTLNLNPCMKFDGYYLFSDFLRIDNLQPRAFALGRWKLRQILLAPNLEAPEKLPSKLHKTLIIYAFITWLYRLVLFTTIALIVYAFTFKLLGIVLFALEIWLLILRPIGNELKQWGDINSTNLSIRRIAVNSSLIAFLLILFVVPWSTRIKVPAVLVAADLTQLYPARAAKIVNINVSREAVVRRGTPLLHLQVPEIENQVTRTRVMLDLKRQRLSRIIADRTDLDESLVLKQELGSLQTKLDGLLKEKRELFVRAPLDGKVLQIGQNLHKGRWVGKKDLLVLIASGQQYILKGYASQNDRSRLTKKSEGLFIPDDLTRPAFPVRISRIAHAGSHSIHIPELASTNGGPIPVVADDTNRLIPATAHYQIELKPLSFNLTPNQLVRGLVHLNGTAESFLARTWRQVTKVLVRESGF